MELSEVFHSISIIAIMILIGTALARVTPITEDTRRTYTTLIVNVAMPCIILSSIFKVSIDESILRNMGLVFLLSIGINLIGIGIGWFFASASTENRKLRQEIALLSGLGNTGFIGIPLCAAILGPEGALYAAVFDAGVDLVIWTVGVMILNNSFRFTWATCKSLINIPLIAIIFGLLFAVMNYRPPSVFIELTNQLAALASPLAMFYIGLLIMFRSNHTVKTRNSNLIAPVVSKLIILPLITLSIIRTFPIPLNDVTSKVLLMQAMMPTLTLASILFTKHSKNDVFGALTTITSTILALLTIPLLILLFSKFNYM
ncbi:MULTISPECIES: AEC family transporter [unclassified Sporosarcina]|uniref:AEC family transporter n=1 Tax=unclassified Sporosarcina TaxID=2647733 RepID=UPI00203F9BD6|nr:MULTISPECIES: AEC family transporter [unclassified Sporosarcina]GKV65873.1 permease [Sporosarcina sp. NCCP-2331]GLB55998.1 permease [Sporosarcina sp. NCCP-2378]